MNTLTQEQIENMCSNMSDQDLYDLAQRSSQLAKLCENVYVQKFGRFPNTPGYQYNGYQYNGQYEDSEYPEGYTGMFDGYDPSNPDDMPTGGPGVPEPEDFDGYCHTCAAHHIDGMIRKFGFDDDFDGEYNEYRRGSNALIGAGVGGLAGGAIGGPIGLVGGSLIGTGIGMSV